MWKRMLDAWATPPFVWQLPKVPFFAYRSNEEQKPSVLESNTLPLICYESHFYKQWGFLDSPQLLKRVDWHEWHYQGTWYLWVLPYHKPSWSSWPLVLWVAFTLQIGPVCDSNLFASVWVRASHSVMSCYNHNIIFIHQLVVCSEQFHA
jgi:hypothetical protein